MLSAIKALSRSRQYNDIILPVVFEDKILTYSSTVITIIRTKLTQMRNIAFIYLPLKIAERELLKRLGLAPDVLDAVREQLDQAVLQPANAGAALQPLPQQPSASGRAARLTGPKRYRRRARLCSFR